MNFWENMQTVFHDKKVKGSLLLVIVDEEHI